jgi:hypothetical protein
MTASPRLGTECASHSFLQVQKGVAVMHRLVVLTLVLTLTLLSGTVAQATSITYIATLSGLNEAVPNASPGTGYAVVVVDTVANTMSVQVTFSDLVAGTAASHIHCCTAVPYTGTAGVATATPYFPGFPIGVTSGAYGPVSFDLTSAASYNPAFVAANGGSVSASEATLLAGLAGGSAYFNIHTTTYPAGEIRGFLHVPDPGSSLLLLGMGLVGLRAWKRLG